MYSNRKQDKADTQEQRLNDDGGELCWDKSNSSHLTGVAEELSEESIVETEDKYELSTQIRSERRPLDGARLHFLWRIRFTDSGYFQHGLYLRFMVAGVGTRCVIRPNLDISYESWLMIIPGHCYEAGHECWRERP